jgi:hypothetical protein
MSTLIIESCEKVIDEVNSPSSIVHVKNSSIIAKHLNADLISHQSQIDNVKNNEYDNIICAYGSPYMKYNAYLEILDNNPNAKMYWLVNDHDVEDNILLRKWLIKNNRPYHMICNNPRSGYRGWILRKSMNGKTLNDWIDEWHNINLNTLIFNEDLFYKTYECNTRENNLIYYGTFRKHRIKDMLDYNGVNYHISTSKKNQIKFANAGVNANFIEKLMWSDKPFDMFEPVGLRLRDYKYSLYLEDDHTHSNYAFMANRFYECVMNNTILFFDHRCQLVIERSGYAIDPFLMVKNADELNEKMEILNSDQDSFNYALNKQRSNFDLIVKEKNKVLDQLTELLEEKCFI